VKISLRVTASGALFTGKAPEIVQKKLEEAIVSATGLLHREVVARTPQGVFGAQGGLIGAINANTDVLHKGTPAVKGIISTGLHAYGVVIEKGRRPGKGVDVDKSGLIGWVIEKLKISDPKKARNVAMLISMKIKREGFAGAHMFEKAFDAKREKIEEIFNKAGFDMSRELSE
jgi:hypothetical protein